MSRYGRKGKGKKKEREMPNLAYLLVIRGDGVKGTRSPSSGVHFTLSLLHS
jgi:hypothetical protein